MWKDLAIEQQQVLAALLTRTHDILKIVWPPQLQAGEYHQQNQLLAADLQSFFGEDISKKLQVSWRVLARSTTQTEGHRGAYEQAVTNGHAKVMQMQAAKIIQMLLQHIAVAHAKDLGANLTQRADRAFPLFDTEAKLLADMVLLCPKFRLREDLYGHLVEVHQEVVQHLEGLGAVRGPSQDETGQVDTCRVEPEVQEAADCEAQAAQELLTGLKGWAQYTLPDNAGFWWFHEETEDWFREDDPDEWRLFTNPSTGKQWWWNDETQDGFQIGVTPTSVAPSGVQ